MKLNTRSRIKVAQKLLRSLDDLSEIESEELWAQEAFRRHEDIMKGKAKLRPAGQVIQKARARLT